MKKNELDLLVEDTVTCLSESGQNLLDSESAVKIMKNDAAFGKLIENLSEGLTESEAADFAMYAENTRVQFLKEGALNASLYAFAPMQMTLIRSVLPRLVGRKLVNHEVMKSPAEKYGVFRSYIVDHAGNKVEVSKINSNSNLSTGYRTDAFDSLPLKDEDLFDLLSAADKAIEVKEVDRRVSITSVTMTVKDNGNANPEDKTFEADFKFSEDGVLAAKVSATHSDGTVTTDTIFAEVDFISGAMSLTSASSTVKGICLKWRLSTEHNNTNVYEMSVEYEKDQVEVDSGRTINTSLPYNYLEDIEALFSTSGLAQASSMMADAQLILEDKGILDDVIDATDGVTSQTLDWDYSYDSSTAGISRQDHNLELLEKINYAIAMSDDATQFNNVEEINIACNPVDAAKVSNTALINANTYEGGVVNGQFNGNYKVGQMISPNGVVNLVSTRQLGKGGMHVIPKSSNRDQRVITQYTYSNVVFANSEIRNSKDPLVKNMCSNQRSTRKTYNGQAISKLAIANA